jgi:hypothetical protein
VADDAAIEIDVGLAEDGDVVELLRDGGHRFTPVEMMGAPLYYTRGGGVSTAF